MALLWVNLTMSMSLRLSGLLFDIKAQLKVRYNYVMLDTKPCGNITDRNVKGSLLFISNFVREKLLGIKGFTFRVWFRSLRNKKKTKSLKAKDLKIRSIII